MSIELYLASASPRRQQLLQQLGLNFTQVVAAVDETPAADEAASRYVCRLALAKARAGQALPTVDTSVPVLGADTTVVIDDSLLGKPHDRAEGLAMLARLSGREHQVLSAVAVVCGEQQQVCLHTSRVVFRELSAAECAAYWNSGEPVDKAGAYGIQGLGAGFVRELHGSHSGVMGLPLFETITLLREFGIDVLGRYSAETL